VKTLEQKVEELSKIMKAEPKKKSLTGFSVNNDLLEQWKKLGALSVDEIEKGLQEKSDQLDGNSAEIEFENLEIGSSKTQP
jgi:hypothetical protein|tara:strand:+ start:1213 stop:1455 length:243 start_codon:yes stop_codon:yes gene_type:complete